LFRHLKGQEKCTAFHGINGKKKRIMEKIFRNFLLLGCLIAVSNCVSSPEVIRDIRVLPQSHRHYLDAESADHPLLTPEEHRCAVERFQAACFSPWHRDAPVHPKEELALPFLKTALNPGYGENKRRHSREWVESLEHNACLEDYPNRVFRAITVDNADLRVLPTHRPHFTSPGGPGTGFPFDHLQNSSIHVHTPVLVTHASRDKSWLFVESHTGAGWIAARDIAAVDPIFISCWQDHRLLAVLKDETPIYDEAGVFLFMAGIGAFFPLVDKDRERYCILAATPDEDRNARIRRAWVDSAAVRPMPLPPTQADVASLADELLNKPYGWGGLYRNRDCSSTLKDLFTPFGIWLPRHSSHQATESGFYIDLTPLSSESKKQTILEEGIPFFTLLWLEGHIMLYVGKQDGEPIVFHNMWGIKTRNILGREGRKIVGHAALTTLHPGTDLPDVDRPAANLLTRIKGMTLLVDPGGTVTTSLPAPASPFAEDLFGPPDRNDP